MNKSHCRKTSEHKYENCEFKTDKDVSEGKKCIVRKEPFKICSVIEIYRDNII